VAGDHAKCVQGAIEHTTTAGSFLRSVERLGDVDDLCDASGVCGGRLIHVRSTALLASPSLYVWILLCRIDGANRCTYDKTYR